MFLADYGLFDEPPNVYWVSVTTEGGTGYRQKVTLPDPSVVPNTRAEMKAFSAVPVFASAGVGSAVYGVATTAGTATGSVTGVTLARSAAILAAPVTALTYGPFVTANNQPVTSFESGDPLTTAEAGVPASNFAEERTAGETGDDLGPVRLPSGQVYEAPAKSPTTDRGFGRESVLQLPGATEDTVAEGIGDVLRALSAVERDWPYTVVVSDNPFGKGWLSIDCEMEPSEAQRILLTIPPGIRGSRFRTARSTRSFIGKQIEIIIRSGLRNKKWHETYGE